MRTLTRIFSLNLLILWALLPARAAIFDVRVGNNFYDLATVNIQVGDQVRFIWVAGVHPTQSDSSPAAWATFTPSSSNTVIVGPFTRAGAYPYHCTVHAFQLPNGTWGGMVGLINVNGGPLPTTASQSAGLALTLFPNPARGQVAVQLQNAPAGNSYQLRMTNVLGREVRRVGLPASVASPSSVPVDLQGLPAGLYFCSLLVNDQTVSTNRLTVL